MAPDLCLNFYAYNGKRVLDELNSTVFVILLLDKEGDGVEEGPQVGVFPVKGGRETKLTFLHVQIQNIDYV